MSDLRTVRDGKKTLNILNLKIVSTKAKMEIRISSGILQPRNILVNEFCHLSSVPVFHVRIQNCPFYLCFYYKHTQYRNITVDIFKGELAIAILKMNLNGGFDNLIFKNTPFHDRGQL